MLQYMTSEEIISKLPYSRPFLFVDEITRINENGVEGNFTFDPTLVFYEGHFKDNPITPGVILIEVMAQIGVVSLGVFLLNNTINQSIAIALTSNSIDFLKPVLPSEKVSVISEKIYFRFNKLKCKVEMKNEQGEVVCKGEIAGMIVSK
jgi:3-hydroxyacyl-[acyl-carrier-protein] dehydratase